jgi:peptidyl-prolyl cis-trans isomerase SurA
MSNSFFRLLGLPFSAAAFFAFSVTPALAAPSLIDRLEASVNASLILFSDVQRFRDTAKLRQQLDPLFAGNSIAAKGANASTPDVVDFLISEKLITQLFPIGDPEVENEINSIQANNHIDRAQLKAALADQGFTFDDYFELIRASASKKYLIDRDIRTKVSISDDDVKNYFFNHYAKSASTPSAYHLQIITVSPRNYKTPNAARDVALRAATDLKNGEAFEEVAKRFSDGPTASSGGDLGTVSDDQVAPTIKDQVRKLKIGQVSDVFGSSQAGYNILKLIDMKTADTDRFEKTKDEIRNQLSAAEYQHQISLWLDRQRQTAFIHRAGESAVAGLPKQP